MIISHRHRYIFVHCRKTAGSSVSAWLSRFLGPWDIQVGSWPDSLEHGVNPNLRAWLDVSHGRALLSFAKKFVIRPHKVLDRPYVVAALNGAQKKTYAPAFGQNAAHPHARQIAEFAPSAWHDYFKFCFVRNPYDRIVSDFRWRQRETGIQDLSFLEFLKLLDEGRENHPFIPHHYDNWPMYTIDDEIAVDHVGRFETLAADMERICERIGIPFDASRFPVAKSSGRRVDYRQWYGAEERRLVEKLFARELAAFDYQF